MMLTVALAMLCFALFVYVLCYWLALNTSLIQERRDQRLKRSLNWNRPIGATAFGSTRPGSALQAAGYGQRV